MIALKHKGWAAPKNDPPFVIVTILLNYCQSYQLFKLRYVLLITVSNSYNCLKLAVSAAKRISHFEEFIFGFVSDKTVLTNLLFALHINTWL